MNNPILRQTITAAVALAEHRLATLDGQLAPAGGAGYPAYNAAKAGELVAVTVEGVTELVVSEAVAQFEELVSTGDGKVGPAANGGVTIGVALLAGAADGDVIEAIMAPVQEGARVRPVEAAAALGANLLAQLDGTLAGADEYGYPTAGAVADGETGLLVMSGPAKVVSSAAIAAGAALGAAAGGEVATHADNAVKIGRALEAAAAANETILAMIIPN